MERYHTVTINKQWMLSWSSLCEPAISLYSLPRLSPIVRVYIQYALPVDDHACVSLFWVLQCMHFSTYL